MTPAKLRAARERLGLTQEQMAALLGVHWNTLARWERGTLTIRNPTILARAVRDVEWERRQPR